VHNFLNGFSVRDNFEENQNISVLAQVWNEKQARRHALSQEKKKGPPEGGPKSSGWMA
jgi:hypothetical protein